MKTNSKIIQSTMDKVAATWIKDLAFDIESDGHAIRIDNRGEDANTGPGPKKLLLVSLAGCTGMDVVHLLGKMRVTFSKFEIAAEADSGKEHPRVYTEIRLTYRITGSDIDADKVEKAIQLSQEKYCSVSAMLKKNCPIVYRVEIIAQ